MQAPTCCGNEDQEVLEALPSAYRWLTCTFQA
jgi:hypothetical protein